MTGGILPLPLRRSTSPRRSSIAQVIIGENTMKTMIFWLRKGARKPKMHGLATAAGSIYAISDFSNMAKDGKGKLFIVDGPTAEHGRRTIQAYRQGQNLDLGRAAMTACLHGGAVVAIGANACMSIAGASEAKRNHEHRRVRDHGVKVKDTRAIGARTDGAHPSPRDFFGG
jgi:hypothetical protein